MKSFLFIFVIIFSTLAVGQTERLMPFTMQDQYDSTVTDASLKKELVVLLGADRKGSKFTDAWGKTIADSLRAIGVYPRAQYVSVANLQTVPSAMRGMVKRAFKNPKGDRVLLDWHGEFSQAYQFVDDSCMILLFDRERQLVYRKAVTKQDAAVSAEIGRVIRQLFMNE